MLKELWTSKTFQPIAPGCIVSRYVSIPLADSSPVNCLLPTGQRKDCSTRKTNERTRKPNERARQTNERTTAANKNATGFCRFRRSIQVCCGSQNVFQGELE